MRNIKSDLTRFAALVGMTLGWSTPGRAAYETIFLKKPDLPITVFNITFSVGSADDPVGKEGIAELTARLLREGGVKAYGDLPARSREQIEDFLFPFAADIYFSVSAQQTSFRVTTTAADAEKVYAVLEQLFLAPALSEGDFERTRSEMLDILQNQWPREDQEELGKAALERQIFGKSHPYGHVTTGTVKSIQAIKIEDVRSFLTQTYTQKRIVAGVAGVVSTSLEKRIGKAFSVLPEGTAQPIPAAVSHPKGARLLLVKGPFDAVGVHLGHSLPFHRGQKDFAEMYLGSMAFGKHRSFVGRLMQKVREIRGLNYGTYTYVEDFPNGGHHLTEPTQVARSQQAFTLWARPTPLGNGCFLLKQVHREITLLATEGLSADEFSRTQSHVVGATALLATSLDRQLGYAIDSKFYGMDGDYLANLQAEVRKTTREKVNALLKKYIDPEYLEIVVVTPDPERFKKELASSECKIHYAAGVTMPQAVLDEDVQIAQHKIPLERIEVVDSEQLFKE